MTTGDKIAKLRRENNYTQEQLAYIFGVSRQSISKWESGATYPEVDKLIRMGELFGCTMDYLLRDEVTEPSKTGPEPQDESYHSYEPHADRWNGNNPFYFRSRLRERRSERTLWGLPLWQIGRDAHAIFAVGLTARGVVACGMRARGLISVGLLSMGVISIGLVSLGLIAGGLVSLGLLASGCIAVGLIALGSVCLGAFSCGALACGDFAQGALAAGKYFAAGDRASAMIAIGQTQAEGCVFSHIGSLSGTEREEVRRLLDTVVPEYLNWAKELTNLFL